MARYVTFETVSGPVDGHGEVTVGVEPSRYTVIIWKKFPGNGDLIAFDGSRGNFYAAPGDDVSPYVVELAKAAIEALLAANKDFNFTFFSMSVMPILNGLLEPAY